MKHKLTEEATRFFESQIKHISLLRVSKSSDKYECQSACSGVEHYVFGLILKLGEVKLWPRESAELGTAAHLLTTLEAFHMDRPKRVKNCEGSGYPGGCVLKSTDHDRDVNRSFRKQAETLRSLIKLPCLACVQGGNLGDDAVCNH